MRGRPPKDTKNRARRNKVTTAAVLDAPGGLPKHSMPAHRADWTPQTRAAWEAIWASPMAGEYCPEDIHLLTVAIEMLEQFWLDPTAQKSAEVRKAFTAFGLTPFDRRRLNWTFRGKKAEEILDRDEEPERDARDYFGSRGTH